MSHKFACLEVDSALYRSAFSWVIRCISRSLCSFFLGAGSNEHKGQHLTGYVRSVRDDLTAFISAGGEKPTAPEMAREKQEGGVAVGAIARVLDVLARLGEDIGRMVRLEGRVEHQASLVGATAGAQKF